jgi:hypothetical protein
MVRFAGSSEFGAGGASSLLQVTSSLPASSWTVASVITALASAVSEVFFRVIKIFQTLFSHLPLIGFYFEKDERITAFPSRKLQLPTTQTSSQSLQRVVPTAQNVLPRPLVSSVNPSNHEVDIRSLTQFLDNLTDSTDDSVRNEFNALSPGVKRSLRQEIWEIFKRENPAEVAAVRGNFAITYMHRTPRGDLVVRAATNVLNHYLQ